MNDRPAARYPEPRRRRRVSRRRYVARRIGVAAGIGVGVFGLVKAAGALTGGDGEALTGGDGETLVERTGTTVEGGAGTAAVVASSAPVTAPATAPPTEPATTPAPVETGPPSAANPVRLLVVGDSDAGTFGPYLEVLIDDTGVVDSEIDYKVSSGLSRPDFFDWPDHVRTKLEEVEPDIVVVTFGGNDAQGMATIDGDFPDEWADPVRQRETWFPEYRRRVGEFTDLLVADPERTVIWVGIPNDDNPEVTERLRVQDEAVRAALRRRPRVIFVDTWKRFSGRDGNWAEYVIDPRDNRGKDVRADDGFHLNENGAEILALDIANLIRADLEARGAEL